MKGKTNYLLLLVNSLCIACSHHNPIDLQKRLVGEWRVVGSKSQNPNWLIYPLSDGGLFAYDNLSGRWRSYSAWLSNDRDKLLGRQGCTTHYSFILSYLSEQDRVIVDDTIVLEHSKLIPRKLQH
jgi:hypothetical protein